MAKNVTHATRSNASLIAKNPAQKHIVHFAAWTSLSYGVALPIRNAILAAGKKDVFVIVLFIFVALPEFV